MLQIHVNGLQNKKLSYHLKTQPVNLFEGLNDDFRLHYTLLCQLMEIVSLLCCSCQISALAGCKRVQRSIVL